MKPLLKAEIQKRLDLVSERAATLEVRVTQLTDALEETDAQLRSKSLDYDRVHALYAERLKEDEILKSELDRYRDLYWEERHLSIWKRIVRWIKETPYYLP